MNPADMWDELVKQGVPPDEATRRVAAKFGPPPTAADTAGRLALGKTAAAQDKATLPGFQAEGTSATGMSAERRLAAQTAPRTAGELFDDVVRSGFQGATFGFGDEIVGKAQQLALRASGAKVDAQPLINAERSKLASFRRDYPLPAYGAEMAGSVAGGAGLGTALRTTQIGTEAAALANRLAQTNRLTRTASLLGSGAVAGGLAGAGAADEGDRLGGLERGAAFGATAAGVMAPVGKAVGKILPKTAERNAVRSGLVRTLGGQTVEDAARGDILKQLGRSRLSLNELETAAQGALPSETVIDLGGDAMVSRAGGAVATPSRGSVDIRRVLTARSEGQPQRVLSAVENAAQVGPRENVVKALQQEAEDRATASTDWYNTLRSHYDVQPKRITALDSHIGRPSFDDAVKETEAILRERDPQGFVPLIQTSAKGAKQVRPLTFTEADLLKRAMDDVTDVAKVPNPIASGGVTKTRRAAMTTTGSSVTEALDEAFKGNKAAGIPSYAEVRGQHADASQLIDAHAQGLDFLKTPADQLEANLQGMTEPQREFYRKGALATIEDQLARVRDGRDVTGWFQNDLNRRKLRILMGDEQATALEGFVRREAQMHRNAQNILGNSKTAERLAQQADAAGPSATELVSAVTTGSPMPLLNYGLKAGMQRRLQGLTEAQVDALAPMLTAQGPDQVQALVKALREYQARKAAGLTLTNPRAIAQTIGLHTNP